MGLAIMPLIFADLFVENKVVVELKSSSKLIEVHQAQLLNYLTATKKEVGLLNNFGTPRIEVKRIINKICV